MPVPTKDLPQVEDDFVPDTDDFESNSIEDDFIPDEVKPVVNQSKPTIVRNAAPDTFREGFMNSVLGGEALNTGLQGLKGYAKGAILDLPESIISGISSAINTGKNLYNDPVGTISSIPNGLSEMAKGIGRTTMQAGSNPEDFGRMMGQTTGQPLVTAGLAKSAPSVIRGAGSVTKGTGKVLQNYTPISTATGAAVGGSYGGFPGAVMGTMRPFTSPMRMIERGIGRGLESVGNRMRDFRKPSAKAVDGKIVEVPEGSSLVEGQEINPGVILKDPKASKKLRDRIKEIESLPDEIQTPIKSNTPKEQPLQELISELTEGQELPRSAKPRARLNPDGTYTNLDTGEVVNSRGKPMATPKEKGVPPNQRAKIMRGMHDSVDVMFDDANSREIFGAGQSLGMNKSNSVRSNVMQRYTQASERIAKDYGLPIEKARKMVSDYNAKIRELSKQQPKYMDTEGNPLQFKAPSFDEFMDSLFRENNQF